MFGVVGQVLVDAGQRGWIVVPHQDRDREGIEAGLQSPGRPGVPEQVQGIFRCEAHAHGIAELRPLTFRQPGERVW